MLGTAIIVVTLAAIIGLCMCKTSPEPEKLKEICDDIRFDTAVWGVRAQPEICDYEA